MENQINNNITKTNKKFYKVEGSNIFLVPYLKEFVPIYHKWMQDEEILYLTGSEPLSLEEEMENHTSWLFDESKYTFISFKKDPSIEKQDPSFPDYASNGIQAGDINLFFHEYIEQNEAEIDVMVGEKSCRKQGIAQESVQIMMDFGRAYYNKDTFIAKIKKENEGSIKLFEKLGYECYQVVEAFGEVNYKIQFNEKFTKEQFEQKYSIKEIQINE